MNRIIWIICICVFIFVTVFVVSVDNSGSRRVKFTNQNFEIKNEANEVVNETNTRKISLNGTKINNRDFYANNQDMRANNQNLYAHNQNLSNQSNININNSDTNYYSQKNNISNGERINYKNLDDRRLDAALHNAGKIKSQPIEYGEFNYKYKDKKIPVLPADEYDYQNIDWSTWKSNFVNKILDDSLEIKELDNYSDGSWFYYSFIVDDEGRISNISVKSVYLTPADKQKIVRFLKGYQYSYLTKFPEKSKRKTAKISAVMMLSSEETKHSKPSDFRDTEQVKYKVNH